MEDLRDAILTEWRRAAQELTALLKEDVNADGYGARFEAAKKYCETWRNEMDRIDRPEPRNERFGWK